MNDKQRAKLEASILEIAEHHEYTVHVWSWTAVMLRKVTRRMLLDGKLILVRRTRTHYHYRKAK